MLLNLDRTKVLIQDLTKESIVMVYLLTVSKSKNERERACIAYMESTCRFSISIPPPFFKPVSLPLSRIFSILKHPNKSFFNPINIFDIFLHTLYLLFYNLLFFVLTSNVLGAGWSLRDASVVEPEPKKLFAQLPVLHVGATTIASKRARIADQFGAVGPYECPCYLYARRTDLYYVFIVDLPAGKNRLPRHWILRGVALLCNTEC